MHTEGKDPPASFAGTHVSAISVLLDFVNPFRPSSTDLDHRSVMALVNVLVQVLYGLDGSTVLNVYVSLLQREEEVVGRKKKSEVKKQKV